MNERYKIALKKHLLATAMICCAQGLQAQTPTQNYIQTRVPRQEIKTDADLNTLTPVKESVMRTIQYVDGLGRPLQTVQVKANPDGTKDVVQPVAYDEYGREATKYLPFAYTGTADGSYRSDAITKQAVFYYPSGSTQASGTQQGNGIVYNKFPFATTVFEPSPLNRVTEQGAPGDVWQPAPASPGRTNATGRTVVTEYTFNDQTAFGSSTVSNPGSRRVAWYAVNSSGLLTRGTNPYYDSNQLYVTIIKDENWTSASGCFGTTEEYKDKEGHVLLKRTYNLKTVAGTTTAEMLSTYYVYDDLGNLSYVLPPNANPDMATGTPVITTLDNLCYQYRYDSRNRLSRKKLPGKGWEFIVYNTLDQVTFTQDAVQRGKANQEWTFSRYDAFGRQVMTGIWLSGDPADNTISTPSTSRFEWLMGWSKDHYPLWATKDNSTATGYNTDTPPGQLFTVNYYDNYTGIPNLPSTFVAPTGASLNTTGLLTATKTVVLNTITNANPDYLWSATYYDEQGRNIKSYKQHYLGGGIPSLYNYDEVTSSYNFNDQVKTVTRKHYTKNAAATAAVLAVTIINGYDYDHMGRKINTSEQIITPTNTGPNILLAKNDYNDVGQLKTKHLHSATGAAPFLQDIDYGYNERGWLKTMNKDAITAPSATKLFGIELYYNDGTNQQFNGNIAALGWRIKPPAGLYDQAQKYGYTYDNINRLTLAQYNPGLTNTDKFNEEVSYDLMGNIATLKRKNSTTAGAYLNNFVYDYTSVASGNKLWKVTDGATPYTYSYDQNGNMLTDARSQITGITYNMLNLPETVSSSIGNLTNVYDASGSKLKKIAGGITREYISGIEYNNSAIESIATEEGRAIPNGSGYMYEYYLKDHLGNTRAAFNQSGAVIQVQDYYAFGLDMNPGNAYIGSTINNYKYNGKEKQETGQYDYGARFYDPVIARWTAVDPLAEKSRRFSPYNYVMDNPLRFIDPDGMAADTANKGNKKNDAQTGSYTNYHERGKYHGKGGEDRADKSAKEKADKYDDPHVRTDWTPAPDDRQAFKDEDDRIKTDDGGHKSPDNYNQRRSPGEKYKEEDKKKDPGQSPIMSTPVPAGGVAPNNNGLVQKISNATGLTGTALIIYIVISEGSRLFPPRNLVPIP